MSQVACGSCSACCKHQIVVLVDEDLPNLDAYQYEKIETHHGTVHTLKIKPNGDCAHLGPSGCEIYEKRPYICRIYDCRKQFKIMSRGERRQIKTQDIWKAARERIHTLDDADLADLGQYRASASQGMKKAIGFL